MNEFVFCKTLDTWNGTVPEAILERYRQAADGRMVLDGAWFVPSAWELEAVTYGTSDHDYAASAN